jgi:hypothetical protein
MRFMSRHIVGYAVVWLIVVAVVLWADRSAEEHRATQSITSFDIVVEDDGGHTFADAELIDSWLVKHDIHPKGRTMADVDLARIEEVVMSHSAVRGANVYMTYSGDMVLNVSLRSVVGRLRLAGYDMYISSDGALMPPEDGYLVAVPVVTGDYKPLFESDFVGNHTRSADDYLQAIEGEFDAIERERESLLSEREANDAELRRIVKQGVKRTPLMSDYEYSGRVASLRERKSKARRDHATKDRDIELKLRALDARRGEVALERVRILGMVEDFSRVVAFVEMVGADPFWSAEIVQIELSGDGDGAMQLAIVPRSGDFIVDLGTTDNLDVKLATLYDFYTETLSNIGWDKYKHISLRYKGQVVCR